MNNRGADGSKVLRNISDYSIFDMTLRFQKTRLFSNTVVRRSNGPYALTGSPNNSIYASGNFRIVKVQVKGKIQPRTGHEGPGRE
jgi:hypothetical protein